MITHKKIRAVQATVAALTGVVAAAAHAHDVPFHHTHAWIADPATGAVAAIVAVCAGLGLWISRKRAAERAKPIAHR